MATTEGGTTGMVDPPNRASGHDRTMQPKVSLSFGVRAFCPLAPRKRLSRGDLRAKLASGERFSGDELSRYELYLTEFCSRHGDESEHTVWRGERCAHRKEERSRMHVDHHAVRENVLDLGVAVGDALLVHVAQELLERRTVSSMPNGNGSPSNMSRMRRA